MELYNSSKYTRYLIHLFHDWPLRSGRIPDHDANMDLLCCANRALRRRVYSSLRPGARTRHSSGKACRARRSEGNRVTTVDRSGRKVSLTSNPRITLQAQDARSTEKRLTERAVTV